MHEQSSVSPKTTKKLPKIDERSQNASVMSVSDKAPSQLGDRSSISMMENSKKLNSDGKKAARQVVYREGGRHDLAEKLMIFESDRTSPMLRSIQSHQ